MASRKRTRDVDEEEKKDAKKPKIEYKDKGLCGKEWKAEKKPETKADMQAMIDDGRSGDAIRSAVEWPDTREFLKEDHPELYEEVGKRLERYARLPKKVKEHAIKSDYDDWDLEHGGPNTVATFLKWAVDDDKREWAPIYVHRNPTLYPVMKDAQETLTHFKGLLGFKTESD